MEPTTTTSTTTTTAPPKPNTTTTAPEKPFERPEALWFVARKRPDGRPAEHLAGYGIPARHVRPGDPPLRRLTDEQMKLALDSGLYRRTRPKIEDDPWATDAERAAYAGKKAEG